MIGKNTATAKFSFDFIYCSKLCQNRMKSNAWREKKESESSVNNGQLRLRIKPRLTHAKRLDQNFVKIFFK